MIKTAASIEPSRTIPVIAMQVAHGVEGGSARTPCSSCPVRSQCLPRDLGEPDVLRLDALAFGRRRLAAGQLLYHAGDGFGFIYAVRRGTFKSSLLLEDGREQVSGFHMAGDLLGLDGVAISAYGSTATALEDADVCVIRYASLTALAAQNTELQQLLVKLMSREIVREHELMLLLGSMHAEERLAAFLLNLSERLRDHGWSPREFHMRMSRAEIGSYLGLTLETVSRMFSALQRQGVLDVDKRHVRIADFPALERTMSSHVH